MLEPLAAAGAPRLSTGARPRVTTATDERLGKECMMCSLIVRAFSRPFPRFASLVGQSHCPGMTPQSLLWWFLQGSFQGLFRRAFGRRFTLFLQQLTLPRRSAPQRIWMDCQGVLQRATGLLEGTWWPKPGSANSDLWKRVQLVMGDLVPKVTVHKVTSHMDYEAASDVVDAWAFRNNADVDDIARAAYLQRSQDFCELWEDV